MIVPYLQKILLYPSKTAIISRDGGKTTSYMIMTQVKTKLAMAAMAVDCEGCISISRVRAETKIGTP